MTGLFIAFEGGDGAGKSTQIRLLAEALATRGVTPLLTREPGATRLGEQIRTVLLDPANDGMSDRAEALLYAADRADHVDRVVGPALRAGRTVITDRYMDSSIAYQGAGRALARDEIEQLSVWATGGLRPDLTVLLDIDPATGLGRATGGGDRLEAEAIDFHERVRAGFRELAGRDPGRYLVLDATRPRDEVHAAIAEAVRALLPGC